MQRRRAAVYGQRLGYIALPPTMPEREQLRTALFVSQLLTGYGFPLYRGGPMFYADTLGLYNVVRRMRELAAIPGADADFWRRAPLLAKLAAEGRTFNG